MELYRFDSQPGAAGNYTLDQAATTSRFASPQVGKRAGAAVAIRPAQRMFCAQDYRGFQPSAGVQPGLLIQNSVNSRRKSLQPTLGSVRS